jgi:hypothetical protein
MSATTTKLTDNDMKVLVNFIPDQQLISLKYTSQDTPEVTAVPRSEWSCFWKVTNSFSRLMSCLGLSFFTYYEFRLNRILTHLTKISWSAQLQNASSIESRAYSKVCGPIKPSASTQAPISTSNSPAKRSKKLYTIHLCSTSH